jgi:hypothetical protein
MSAGAAVQRLPMSAGAAHRAGPEPPGGVSGLRVTIHRARQDGQREMSCALRSAATRYQCAVPAVFSLPSRRSPAALSPRHLAPLTAARGRQGESREGPPPEGVLLRRRRRAIVIGGIGWFVALAAHALTSGQGSTGVSAGRRSIGMTAIVTQRNVRCQLSVLRVAGGCSRLRAALAALRRVQPCGTLRARRPPLPLSRLMAGSAGRSPPGGASAASRRSIPPPGRRSRGCFGWAAPGRAAGTGPLIPHRDPPLRLLRPVERRLAAEP